jgi:hypothetical protein
MKNVDFETAALPENPTVQQKIARVLFHPCPI